MFSGMLLVAVFTQKLLGYDAWTSGLVLAPGGLGNIFSLFASGMVTRVDQRLMLAFGCLLNAAALYMMTSLTLGMDYWALALPRFIQGFAIGFIFVPLSTLTLATIRRDKLVNATAIYSMMRNVGGSVGIAVATTLLAQRSQFHQSTLVSHITPWDTETRRAWRAGPATSPPRGATPSPPSGGRWRCSIGRRYQAQLLAYADDFWLLAVMFAVVPLFLPLMRRIRLEPPAAAPTPERAPAHALPPGLAGRARVDNGQVCRDKKLHGSRAHGQGGGGGRREQGTGPGLRRGARGGGREAGPLQPVAAGPGEDGPARSMTPPAPRS